MSIDIRGLTEHSDLQEAVRIQQAIWGFDEIDLLPLRLFVVATKIGGQVFGAFDGRRMVGFCLAIPGLKPGGKSYLHSHMLGVLPEYRDAKIGRLLKFAQRDDAIARDIDLIEWTFDPLELKNAFFNMERLGAVVRRYVLNQYGTTTSRLHSGLPTDRCIAEWWIRSPRARAISGGAPFPRAEILARVELPAGIANIRMNDFERAREIQKRVANEFLHHLGSGLAVVGFERSPSTGTYLLGKWEGAGQNAA